MTPEPQRGADLPEGYVLRRYRAGDAPALLDVENRAAQLFRTHGYPEVADHPLPDIASLTSLMAGCDVWVIAGDDDRPAGFAVAGWRGSFLHLRELSVDPDHGRKGFGSALVRHVVEHARDSGATGVSLTTFRSVPFNAPFYARLGFGVVEPSVAPDELRAAFDAELPFGVPPQHRVLMLQPL